VTTTYWVPTIGNTLPPLPAGSGGTGSALGGPFWIPPDDQYIGFNSDPATASGGGLLVATNAYLARMPIRTTELVSNLWICMSSAGVGTSVTSFLWIVSGVTGAVLAQSTAAAAQAAMTGTGWQPVAMQTPVTIQPGTFPYAVILPNLLTTQPSLLRQNNSQNAAPQSVSTPASFRWAQQAGFGSAVGPVTLASNAATAFTNIVGWN
jgi:hypothetical protein